MFSRAQFDFQSLPFLAAGRKGSRGRGLPRTHRLISEAHRNSQGTFPREGSGRGQRPLRSGEGTAFPVPRHGSDGHALSCPVPSSAGDIEEWAEASLRGPRLPEKCHHLLRAAGVVGASCRHSGILASPENRCVPRVAQLGRPPLLPGPGFGGASRHRRELEDLSALNLLCQGASV